ncbi:MAG TPA: YbhB/YbcL family Raf kinase inhibitor-like protein [Alphaproteobacteria bacterium]|nr:YbhB/YbcL family Raf kinase inhibitor-like protein [Alphaproteobacteria bacterium]HNS45529.1 YbhB/YbcL family Raf kinase inhibitor-like protein [Alphaproteobacteria bacterium]
MKNFGRLLMVMIMCALPFSPVKADPVDFKVTSPDFKEDETLSNKHVYNGFGCTGENVAPRLNWESAPADTKYFAVTVYDPDAPTGSGWWHWLIVNLPKSATSLDRTHLPTGALETRTDFGTTGYGGPCPPVGHGPHRYIFTLYALKDKIDVVTDTPAAQVGYQINSLKVGETSIMGYFERK